MAPQIRLALRWLHILLALCVGAILYSPLHAHDWAWTFLLWIAYPALGVAGLVLWQLGRILAFARRNGAKRSGS